jgi:transcriptional regulator with XRE-family HTH domain
MGVDSRWEAFGAWLREERGRQRLSQDESAGRAEMTKQQWSRIERGESGTRRETVERMARAVRASVPDALRRAGYLPDDDHTTDQTWASMEAIYSGLPPDDQAELRAIAEMKRKRHESVIGRKAE